MTARPWLWDSFLTIDHQTEGKAVNTKIVFWDFVANFSLTIVVAAVVTFLWSLIAHGSGIIDWEISVVMATVMGTILASRKIQELKQK